MRLFKLRSFARFCRKAGIDDAALSATVADMAAGLIDADLGGGVFKQRVARRGGGKSGGFRTLLLMRRGSRVVFVKGFAKKDRDNIDERELVGLRDLAPVALGLGEDRVAELVVTGEWIEIDHEA